MLTLILLSSLTNKGWSLSEIWSWKLVVVYSTPGRILKSALACRPFKIPSFRSLQLHPWAITNLEEGALGAVSTGQLLNTRFLFLT